MANFAREEFSYNLTCLRYRLGRGAGHRPRPVLVNGSPKSGTTWMLQMIGSIPGHRIVGNFNGDIARYGQVRPGDVVHGHDWFREELGVMLQAQDVRVVLMIRDPRDQLVSRMFHVRRSERHTWHEQFQSLSNDEALMLCIEGRDQLPGADVMIKIPQSWLHSGYPVLCIRYEDLLADPVAHFSRVLTFLGIEHNALARSIVQRNRFERLSVGRQFWRRPRKPGQEDASSHYRKGITGDWRNHLNEAHVARLKEIAGRQLIDFGYEQDLNWSV